MNIHNIAAVDIQFLSLIRYAKLTLARYPTDFLLGDLLLKAGVITQRQLDEAVKLAGSKTINVGQMLIMGGSIRPRDLQAAVDAQSALSQRLVMPNLAVRVLKVAIQKGIPFMEVWHEQQAGHGSGSVREPRSRFTGGAEVKCKIQKAVPGGYEVTVQDGNVQGFLPTGSIFKIGEDIVALFVAWEKHGRSDRMLLAKRTAVKAPGPKSSAIPLDVREACLTLGIRSDTLSRQLVIERWSALIGGTMHTDFALMVNLAKEAVIRWLDEAKL